MSEEELEREARINLKRRFGEFFPQLTISYVMGAEPREKRIEELELKIKLLTQHLDPQSMTALLKQVSEEFEQKQKLKKLDKENAELKEQNSHLYNDLTMTEAENAERKVQHTKAKEIIKFLINYEVLDKPQYYEWRLKAEQFLKEIEK